MYALKFMDSDVPFLRTVSKLNLSPHFRASPTLEARGFSFSGRYETLPISAAVWAGERNINAQKCRWRIHPSRKPHAARINKKKSRRQKKASKKRNWHARSSSTLFFSLTSKVTFAPGLAVRRHALLSTTTFYPSTPTSRDQTQPRLRKSTPGWRGWLRRLCKTKLGQADSRQVESGRDSRVVQAFSVRSSPSETTPKSVVVSPLRRHPTCKSTLARQSDARHPLKSWSRNHPGCKENPEKLLLTGLSEYGDICIGRQFISSQFTTRRCLSVFFDKILWCILLDWNWNVLSQSGSCWKRVNFSQRKLGSQNESIS